MLICICHFKYYLTPSSDHVKALRKELFQTRGYDIMARPVLNYSHPINVSIYLDINYIKQLDVVTNVLESEGWIRLSWSDENLKWDSEKYGGLSDIRVRIDEGMKTAQFCVYFQH